MPKAQKTLTTPDELTRGQKAAATRKANQAKKLQEQTSTIPNEPTPAPLVVVQEALQDTTDLLTASTTVYTGPMLALRERVKAGAYKKAANGQPSCGDALAQALGVLQPTQVIRACLIALAYDANPYTHLNIGQQSMNLRNRVRNALTRGDFGMGVVTEAVEEVQEATA